MTEHQTVYEKALIKWGVDSQIDMLIEEMAELTVSLMHRKRGRVDNVPEEFADVEIVMAQLRPYFNDNGVIDNQKKLKIARLSEKLTLYI